MLSLTFLTQEASAFLLSAAEKSADGGKDSGSAFPPFDPQYFAGQIFWLLISFAILYFMLSRVFLPRIGQTLEDRSNRIADDLDTAAQMQAQAEDASKSYERSLSDARAKAHNVAESTRASVDAELAKEMAEADAMAEKQAEVAEARIRKIRTDAMANIDSIAADVAQAAIEAVSGKKMTAAAVTKAVKAR
jgi:F-type H+-transporting ATPase subunit b